MYASWKLVFPERGPVRTRFQTSDDLIRFPNGHTSLTSCPAISEEVAADGSTVLLFRPPKHGRGSWLTGGILGAILVGVGVVTLVVPAGGEASPGSVGTAWGAMGFGAAFAALMLTYPSHWILDADGAHAVTGWGRRTTLWSDVARLRLLSLPRLPTHAAYANARLLLLLDAHGREIGRLPHTTGRGLRRIRQTEGADRDILLSVADECHRRGWLTGFDAFRAAGNAENITPLMDVSGSRGDLADLEDVLATAPDLEARDAGEGLTALHYAAAWGTPEKVQRLIAAGADIDARTPYGFTPLRMAERRNRPTAEILRHAGATAALPPLEGVRFSRRHWIPVGTTLAMALLLGSAAALPLGVRATLEDLVFFSVAIPAVALLALRLARPLLFWSGGVPSAQDGPRLTLRRPWGRRCHLDLARVTSATRTPPVGHRAGSIHGAGVLLVTPERGWHLKGARLAALHISENRRERLIGTRGRAVLVVLDPDREAEVLDALVPQLVAADASVDPELLRMMSW